MPQRQGLSLRAYAEHRGVSHTAVQKAVRSGRIPRLDDGSIDPEAADRAWAANTDVTKSSNSVTGNPRHRRDPTAPPVPAGGAAAPRSTIAEANGGGSGYVVARGARESYAAGLMKLKYHRELGSLLDAEGVELAADTCARRTAAAILAMPTQVGPQLAALGIPLESITAILTAWARRACADLSQPTERPLGKERAS